MGAVPKQRVTRARQGMRRMAHAVKLPQLMTCPRCRELKVTHEVCPNCGTYNGMDILRLNEKAKKKPE